MGTYFLLSLVVFVVMAGISWLASLAEARDWNGGTCRTHGTPWACFDTDSQGGRMYKCTSAEGRCHCEISYPIDNAHPKRNMLYHSAWMLVISLVIVGWASLFAAAAHS